MFKMEVKIGVTPILNELTIEDTIDVLAVESNRSLVASPLLTLITMEVDKVDLRKINEASTDTASVSSCITGSKDRIIQRLLRSLDESVGKVCLVLSRQSDKSLNVTIVEAKFTASFTNLNCEEIKAYIDLRSIGHRPLQHFRSHRRSINNAWFLQSYSFHMGNGIKKLIVYAYFKYAKLYLCVGQAEIKIDDISQSYGAKTVWLKLRPARIKNKKLKERFLRA